MRRLSLFLVLAGLLATASGMVLAGEAREIDPQSMNLPQLIPESRTNPIYPPKAREQGIEGKVAIRLIIGTDGVPKNLEVLQVTPEDMGFKEAALAVVEKLRWKPATDKKSGKPIEVFWTYLTQFKKK